ncbi:FecR domain-containing protein [filamentous cyanobacterium LEGE 11480]|uniref:FecR domain-containing protein n=1 Tax=Romeriopsis navalis LEGE 11480 TaxID=2777977 RepID=A0A928VPR7_9CYAN|nr:FecR family protein [Romeriopsis navalis]MBE9030277.1 FecR domain-containing protein [Romeriopsis navalis LEGE 11480]
MLRRRFLALFFLLGAFAGSRKAAWARPMRIRTGSWLEVRKLKGKAIYQDRRGRWRAWVGLRFQTVGDRFETTKGASAVLRLESGIGTIYVSESTKFSLKQRYTTKDGGIVTQLHVTQGQIRLKVRKFTNPSSRLEILTPAGIAGVRGTEFGVSTQPSGQTGIATRSGRVAAIAQSQTVDISNAQQTLIAPQSPPTSAQPLKDDPGLYLQVAKLQGKRVQLMGKVDPVNVLLIEDVPQSTASNGAFNYLIAQWRGNVVRVKVITPLGTERRYELPVIA